MSDDQNSQTISQENGSPHPHRSTKVTRVEFNHKAIEAGLDAEIARTRAAMKKAQSGQEKPQSNREKSNSETIIEVDEFLKEQAELDGDYVKTDASIHIVHNGKRRLFTASRYDRYTVELSETGTGQEEGTKSPDGLKHYYTLVSAMERSDNTRNQPLMNQIWIHQSATPELLELNSAPIVAAMQKAVDAANTGRFTREEADALAAAKQLLVNDARDPKNTHVALEEDGTPIVTEDGRQLKEITLSDADTKAIVDAFAEVENVAKKDPALKRTQISLKETPDAVMLRIADQKLYISERNHLAVAVTSEPVIHEMSEAQDAVAHGRFTAAERKKLNAALGDAMKLLITTAESITPSASGDVAFDEGQAQKIQNAFHAIGEEAKKEDKKGRGSR